ncbi:hypothetical protein FCM35_KLT01762 [Carex littledalei]|uniref:Uncharacterized protein n=1 Tax=Carex littledalei TaxID=544730 RepID=A0A833RDH3_9POAL|nr:hypothetical protein FCM35_KLT01762 [Carex littledalei]
MLNPELKKRLTAQQVLGTKVLFSKTIVSYTIILGCKTVEVDRLIDTMRDSNPRELEQVVVEIVLSSTREQEGHLDEGFLSEVNAQLRQVGFRVVTSNRY